MKRLSILLIAISLFVGLGAASAQSRTSYFMEGSYFRTELNPALAPTRGYVAIPLLSGVGINESTNYLSAQNFFFEKNGGLVTGLHSSVSTEEFLKRMPDVARADMGLHLTLVGVGFYAKDIFWTVGANAHVVGDLALPTNIFTAMKTLGNGTYDMGNAALDVTGYVDAYVGASFPVCDWMNVGAKVKFLVGGLNAGAKFSQLNVNITPDSVDGTLDGEWRGAGFLLDGEWVEDAPETDGSCGFGLAADLGAEARFLDNRLRVSAAVTDLGFIRWGKKSHTGGAYKGDFYYRGFNFDSGEVDADSSFGDVAYEPSGYTTRLQCSLNIGAEYNIWDDRIGFGLLSHTKFCNTMTYSELTASVNFRPFDWLSATVSHTFLNRNPAGIFGVALNIHPKGFNLFVGADFLGRYVAMTDDPDTLNVYLPRRMKSVNLYAGIGFNFGDVHKASKAFKKK